MSTENVNPRVSVGIVFSDNVIREHGTGKLTIVGTFQILNAQAFPFLSPPFQVTAFIEDFPTGQPVTASVVLENENGARLASASGQLTLEAVVEPGGQVELPFPMPQVNFQSPGVYLVRVLVADQEIGRKPLYVRSITQQPQVSNN